MKLKTVTFTGADESVLPMQLVDLTNRYPFVEFGILLSASREGSYRFPSQRWLEGLAEVHQTFNLPLCGHICGRWVRNIVGGHPGLFDERPEIVKIFKRFQLNFHAKEHHGNVGLFTNLLKKFQPTQFIVQHDGVNNHYLDIARSQEIDAVPLFDLSGGAGIVPKEWPKPIDDLYCGYAGGLGPKNLEAELKRIEAVVPDEREIWIDMERRIRSEDDSLFDLDAVEECLKIAKAYT